jgi:hypothetical protein
MPDGKKKESAGEFPMAQDCWMGLPGGWTVRHHPADYSWDTVSYCRAGDPFDATPMGARAYTAAEDAFPQVLSATCSQVKANAGG